MLFTLKSSVAVWYTDTYVLVKNIHELKHAKLAKIDRNLYYR